MIRYVFKEAPIALRNAAKADPQKLGEALAAISKRDKGRVTPEAVVNDAKALKSPLHPHFEWNDKVAAQAFRLDQARVLIRSIRVENEETAETSPAFISVADHGVAYRTLEDVINSRDLQFAVLRQAERDLKAFERRYHMLSEICAQVKAVREDIERKLNSNTETRQAAA